MISFRVRRKFLLVAGGILLASLAFAWVAPNLLRWRLAEGERTPAKELRLIDEAVKTYISKRGTAPPTLIALRGHIPSEWSCGTPPCEHLGYRVQYTVLSQDAGGPRYSLTAEPLQHGVTGVRSFYLDQSGVLRCTKEARAATSNDSPLPDCGKP
ncbi:MAG TPA: hypothetical protein VF786_11755 [Terriglobales bacterium]